MNYAIALNCYIILIVWWNNQKEFWNITVTPKECNSRIEIWHWTKDEMGVPVRKWLSVRVELTASYLNWLERLNEIQWSWVQIPHRPYFQSYLKEYFSGEYHMHHFILLDACDYLKKILIKINVATDEGKSWHEIWHWTNDKIWVVIQSWLWVLLELMAR